MKVFKRTIKMKFACCMYRAFALIILWMILFLLPGNCMVQMAGGIATVNASSKQGKVSLNKKKVTVNKGSKCKIRIQGAPSGAKISWKISNKAVAAIKPKGKVCVITGKKAGRAKITVKVNKKKYNCQVTVKNAMFLTEDQKTIEKGESFILSLKNASSGKFKWYCSSKKILKMTQISKGKYRISAKKTGTAYVFVEADGKILTCKVTVVNKLHGSDASDEGMDKPEKLEEEKFPVLKFLNEDNYKINLQVGKLEVLTLNNPVAQVICSVSSITVEEISNDKKCITVYAINPGKTTVTITDIYGQTVCSEVTITQDIMIEDTTGTQPYGVVHVIDSRWDDTLPVPSISNTFYSRYGVDIICPWELSTDNPNVGYEIIISTSPKFDEHIMYNHCNSMFSNRVYVDIGNQKIGGAMPAGTYYCKVRTYETRGSIKLYGSWSQVIQIHIPDFASKSDSKADYSYQLYFLDNTGREFISGIKRVIYIKTDNPNQGSIDLVSGEESVLRNINMLGKEHYYDDIKYLQPDSNEPLKKVEGGYVGYLEFDDPGTYQIQLREYSSDGYRTAGTYEWQVLDSTKAMNDWIDELIREHTAQSMTPFEKMDAICDYLTTPGLFKYVTMSNGELVELAAVPNSPFFRTYRWDSYVSPAALCNIAVRVGGFSDIHNCYGDHPMGSMEWSTTHYYAELTYDGEERRYQVCPLSNTGEIGEVQYINFSDTSSMTRAD